MSTAAEAVIENVEPSNLSKLTETTEQQSAITSTSRPQEEDNTKIQKDPSKVDVLLKAVGDAPIMKRGKWTVTRDRPIGWIVAFIKKNIGSDDQQQLLVYVNQSFQPALDTPVGTLFDCFECDGKLVLHYCRQAAWG